MNLPFLSFRNIAVAQTIETLSGEGQGAVDIAQSITWLLIAWRRQGPGHQQTNIFT